MTDIDEAYINSIVVRPDNENSIFNSTIDVEHIYPFSNGVFKVWLIWNFVEKLLIYKKY